MALLRARDKDGNYIDIPTLRGESAYEVAVRNGYTGTEEEWVESTNLPNADTLKKLGDSNGSLTYDGKAVGGGGSPTIRRATAMLDYSEGYALAADFGGDTLSFCVTNDKIEEIGANSMIVDVGIVYDGTEHRGANIMRISGIINGAVKVFPFPQEDISSPGDFIVCVLTGCDTNSDLFNDINRNNSLLTTELIIYYCEVEQNE